MRYCERMALEKAAYIERNESRRWKPLESWENRSRRNSETEKKETLPWLPDQAICITTRTFAVTIRFWYPGKTPPSGCPHSFNANGVANHGVLEGLSFVLYLQSLICCTSDSIGPENQESTGMGPESRAAVAPRQRYSVPY